MKFIERDKGHPFTMYDGEGRTVYFNDGDSEYISERITDNDLQVIKKLKEEELYFYNQ